ncbi:MAG: PEP-CTERM sorting domain-containing protein [Candidatus Rokubacteria bacterium]|nr:PEP-CTERM sorting domain-containing protein [Candidatus Rokubacteria bacterium]
MAVLLGLALLLVTASAARAASVTALYLFSTFSTDPSYSGGVTTPFTLTGTAGVRLGLDAFAVATSQTGLGDLESVSAFIDATVTYQGHSGRIDAGEPGPIGARVNSEVGRLDDVGFVAEGDDAALNIDFSYHAKVILKIPMGGFTSLMIAEDAGLDPFKLQRCTDATCSGTPQLLFDGFNSATKNAILARADFGSGDSSPIDQVYLFLFDEPVTGWLRISETKNLGGTRLEVDFVGGLDPSVPVPEPTTFLLWGTTAAGLGLIRWRRRRRAHR